MRKRLIIFVFLFGCCSGLLTPAFTFAKSYHVAITGSDAANPGSSTAPYKTIQRAAEVMSPGDTCYIHAGTYYETVRPAGSGVDGKPLVFTAYRNDEVIVHGGKVLTGWTRYKGNIYKVSVSDTVKDLFSNRQYMLWARHPNMPYDPVKGFDMCRPTLGTANPPAGIDWTGVTVIKSLNNNGWWNTVSKQDTFSLLPEGIDYGGWLMGVPGLIDSEGEWCWKDGTLYFWPIGNQNPNKLLTEAKIRDLAFDLTDRNYIVLDKLTVLCATINMKEASHCTIKDCKVFYVSSIFNPRTFNTRSRDTFAPMTENLQGKGIFVSGSHNTIQNCEIAHSWGNCVSLLGSGHKVYNCEIYDANWIGWECAVVAMNGGGHIIRRNDLHEAQRAIITCTNKIGMSPVYEPSRIDSNKIYNSGLEKTDNGGIYCFHTNGNGTEIAYNWVYDNFSGYSTIHSSMGIYLDDYSMNFIVHHNVVWNMNIGKSAAGIRANNPNPNEEKPNNHRIYNNTMFNCSKAINSPDNDWNGTTGQPYWAETKVFNNILLKDLTFGPATVGNNYTGTKPMFADTLVHDFRLKPGSPCIDSGMVIPGITDGYKGSAPDIGAYEYGGEYWIPGRRVAEEIPLAPERYRRPEDYKPAGYKHSLEDLKDRSSDEMMKRAATRMEHVNQVIAKGPWKPTPESVDRHAAPEWFNDAKFGMFIDWGLWSFAGYAKKRQAMNLDDPYQSRIYPDWYEKQMYQDLRAYHEKNWGSDFKRDDFIPLFKAQNYQPDKLVDIAVEAGMKYIIPFAKHHGGYCLWPSSFTQRDAVEMGPRKDLIKPLIESCKKRNLKFGFYLSIEEWEYPVIGETVNIVSRLWEDKINIRPYNSELEKKCTGKIPVKNYYTDYLVPQATEFIDLYDPDILWYDGEWNVEATDNYSYTIASYFYNQAEGRKEVAVNDRYGDKDHETLRWVRGDIFTNESEGKRHAGKMLKHTWEETRGISTSYGFHWGDTDANVLSSKYFIKMFVEIVSRGGNLLLITNLDGQGALPEIQARRLKDIGKWLKVNGEGIYATRYNPPATSEGNVYFTRSKDDKVVYAIATEWPGNQLKLKSVKPAEGSKVTMLGDGKPLIWTYDKTEGATSIEIPKNLQEGSGRPCENAWTFRIEI